MISDTETWLKLWDQDFTNNLRSESWRPRPENFSHSPKCLEHVFKNVITTSKLYVCFVDFLAFSPTDLAFPSLQSRQAVNRLSYGKFSKTYRWSSQSLKSLDSQKMGYQTPPLLHTDWFIKKFILAKVFALFRALQSLNSVHVFILAETFWLVLPLNDESRTYWVFDIFLFYKIENLCFAGHQDSCVEKTRSKGLTADWTTLSDSRVSGTSRAGFRQVEAGHGGIVNRNRVQSITVIWVIAIDWTHQKWNVIDYIANSIVIDDCFRD